MLWKIYDEELPSESDGVSEREKRKNLLTEFVLDAWGHPSSVEMVLLKIEAILCLSRYLNMFFLQKGRGGNE